MQNYFNVQQNNDLLLTFLDIAKRFLFELKDSD